MIASNQFWLGEVADNTPLPLEEMGGAAVEN